MNPLTSKARFAYPVELRSMPDYNAHRGQIVTVVRPLIDGKEYDGPSAGFELMYEIRAEDSWIGHAWVSELEPV